MIPPMNSAKEAAMETTEEMRKVAKEAVAQGREALHSFYSQVSCTDLSAIQAPDCNHLKGGNRRDTEGSVTLDWRADPFVSMSDLTLVVYDGSGGIPYHVHTLLLAYGGRKSGFVAEQIKGQQNKTKSSSKTSNRSIQRQNSYNSHGSNISNADHKVDIYVPPLAARHMPLFLDYIYGSTLKLTTATAPPLRYLSNRFDCRDLHKEVTSRFIPQDLELSTAAQYCTMADELKDFEMRDKSIRIMAERFEKINVNLLKWMSPRMMRSLVQCERLECGSESLSVKVAQYLRLRDDLPRADKEEDKHIPPLTDEDFYWLTHCAHMPKISPSECLFYFNHGTRYPQVMNEIGSGSLKSRCLAACSDSWAMEKLTAHLENPDHNAMELYENLEPKMKVQLLESSLVGAKKTMVEKGKEFSHRNESDRDMQLSEEIMYKNNKVSSSKVVVLGSGVAPANGLYLYKGKQHTTADNTAPGHREPNDIIVYEKEAVWNHQRVTFVLYPTTSGQYYTQYKLGVRQNNQTKVLYNSPTVMGASGGVIPEQAWEVEEDAAEGLHPPPQFVGRVEQPVSTSNRNLKRSVP
mmetsp:Transcript_20723/g.37411  ORF Transcript_20723/g.37411 Transcript_20723/m.37411 type:complete len:577 (+) Transcript_20723:45-1775(+)